MTSSHTEAGNANFEAFIRMSINPILYISSKHSCRRHSFGCYFASLIKLVNHPWCVWTTRALSVVLQKRRCGFLSVSRHEALVVYNSILLTLKLLSQVFTINVKTFLRYFHSHLPYHTWKTEFNFNKYHWNRFSQ